MARGGAHREARSLHDDRLPHERVGAVLGHRPAGRDLVREERHLQHGPPPVRALVQPGRPAAVGGTHRLGRLQQGRRAVPATGEEAPRRAPRPRRRTAAPRHARGDGAARRHRPRLEARRVRPGPREDDAQADRRRARLRHRARQDDRPRAARRDRRHLLEGHLWKPGRRSRSYARRNGVVHGGVADGRPQLRTATFTSPRRSSGSRGRRTGGSPSRGSGRWSAAPACASPISPRTARTSGSRWSRSASSRARSSPRRSGPGSRAARGATRRSP